MTKGTRRTIREGSGIYKTSENIFKKLYIKMRNSCTAQRKLHKPRQGTSRLFASWQRNMKPKRY